MSHTHPKTAVCQVCGKEHPTSELLPSEVIRPNIAEAIRKDHPQWQPEGFICIDDLNHYRGHYIQGLVEKETGKLSGLEREVIDSFKGPQLLSENDNEHFEASRTFGNRVADRMASFGGSWVFIGLFAATMFLWIVFNTHFLMSRPFDPFPFILLNLCLSCLAAIQAPIIMMSQNRQESRDRLHAESDYRINLKAELEIRLMNEKMDRLITLQWHRLLEIQQIQTDLMEELVKIKN